jgi:hypothetical protein
VSGQDASREQDAALNGLALQDRSQRQVQLPFADKADQTDAAGLHQSNFHARVGPPIPGQEAGEHALQDLGRRPDPQQAGPTLLERPGAIPEGLDVGERVATPAEQILPMWSEADLTADPVEQPKAELALQIADLPGQRGLRDVQPGRGP